MAASSQGCVRARLFNTDGTAAGTDFVLNSTLTRNPDDYPSVAALTDGRFVVAWESNETGNDLQNRIRAQIFDPKVFTGTTGADIWKGGNFSDRISGAAGTDTLSGLGGNDLINGDAGNDILSGGDGNDTLYGSAGADRMSGGFGNDIFHVDAAGDMVGEAAGQGADTVFTSVSYILAAGQHIETLTPTSVSGTGAINLTGNDLAQRINGNNGSNVIYGGAGTDLLVGYGGNDNIEGQAASDTLKGVSGVDKFVFRQSLVATSGADHISNFGADDFIYFDHPSVTGPLNPAAFVVGANALDANDRFICYAPYKALYFDPDGNGAAAKVLFAVFDNGFAPTAADIILF